MGKQYNKVEKRQRRARYLRRKKDTRKAAAKAKPSTPPQAEPAQA